MSRTEINTDDAPESIGPFSQAIRHDGVVYVSGQGPVDPATGDVVGETIEAQTARTLDNIEAILEAAGTEMDQVLKATVFVMDMDDYEVINEVYGEYFSAPYPSRSAVEIVELPVDIRVEIEVIAAA